MSFFVVILLTPLKSNLFEPFCIMVLGLLVFTPLETED